MNLQGGAVWNTNNWMYNPQRTAGSLQGGSRGVKIQGSSPKIQGNTRVIQGSSPRLQVTANPYNYSRRPSGQVKAASTGQAGGGPVSPAGGGGGYDPAAAKAAADAAKAAKLRGEITNIIGSIKDIFNSRYRSAQGLAKEQRQSLNKRFANESGDLTEQIRAENEALGAAAAATGTYDSSYRGNNVDTVTREGERQIDRLGEKLDEDLAAVGNWLSGEKTNVSAQKRGLDRVLSRLSESTDPAELTQLRNSLDSRITELQAQGSANQTKKAGRAALNKIAPADKRSLKLKTTLSQIVAGNADPGLKRSIGERLIANSGVSAKDQQELLQGFRQDVGA